MKQYNYNGWTNQETWNVMLWLNGSENLYISMINTIEQSEKDLTYVKLIHLLSLENKKTGDGTNFLSNKLNYDELNQAIIDISNAL